MSTFRSMFQLCINRDNLAANQISVHQMRKCYKLSILVQFLSVKVLASKQLFIHPCLSLLSSPCSPFLLLHSSPFLLSLPLISPPFISASLLPSFPLSFSVPPSIHHPYCPSPCFCLPSPVFSITPSLLSSWPHFPPFPALLYTSTAFYLPLLLLSLSLYSFFQYHLFIFSLPCSFICSFQNYFHFRVSASEAQNGRLTGAREVTSLSCQTNILARMLERNFRCRRYLFYPVQKWSLGERLGTRIWSKAKACLVSALIIIVWRGFPFLCQL